MDLIQKYLSLATDVSSPDSFLKSVRMHNWKVSRMYRIVEKIERKHPELKDDFCELLFHENHRIRIWVAHQLLERMSCKEEYRKCALDLIRGKTEDPQSMSDYCENLWLQKWYERHPEDRSL